MYDGMVWYGKDRNVDIDIDIDFNFNNNKRGNLCMVYCNVVYYTMLCYDKRIYVNM